MRWSSRRASSAIPSSASTAARPGPQAPRRASASSRRTTGASSARRPCSRRIPNIWIAYVPEASRPVSSLPHSCDLRRPRSAASRSPSQSASAGGVVLGDVEHERLAQSPRAQEKLPERLPGRIVIAEHDVRRHEPRERGALDLDVLELLADLARLDEHRVDLLVRGAPRAPSTTRRGSRRASARSPRRRDIAIASSRASAARRGSPRSSSARASPPSTRARSSESSSSRRRDGLLEQLDRLRVVDRRTPARLLEADRRPREELRVAQRAPERGGTPERLERPVGATRAMQHLAEPSITSARSAGSRTPSSSATRNRSSASPNASALDADSAASRL